MTAVLEGRELSAQRPGRFYPPRERTRNHFTGDWVGPSTGLTGGKSRPHRDSISNRPTRSQSLYRLSYRAHNQKVNGHQ